MQTQTQWLSFIKTVSFKTPTILGIDELHVLGAPRAVFTNLEAHTIIEMFDDKRD